MLTVVDHSASTVSRCRKQSKVWWGLRSPNSDSGIPKLRSNVGNVPQWSSHSLSVYVMLYEWGQHVSEGLFTSSTIACFKTLGS